MKTNKVKALLRRGPIKVLGEKLREKSVFVIPHNRKYRPTMVTHIDGTNPDFEVDRVEASIVSECRVPRAFFERMLHKGYDSVERGETLVTMRSAPMDALVAKLRDGRVYSDNLRTAAIITRRNRLLSDVSFQYVKESTSETNSLIFRQRYFRKPRRIEGTVFVMLSGGLAGRGNYYHWLVDVLPRLHLLARSRFRESADCYLVPQFDRDFQKTTLALAGVRPDQVIACDAATHLQCAELLVSTHPRGPRSILVPDWVIAYYDGLKQQVLGPGDYPKRIYVTRKDSGTRGIDDEDRLIRFLEGYGFTPVTLADYDFDGKVNRFNAAEAIISAHGAGLTNLFFANCGTAVLELFSEGFVDPFLFNIAERKGLDYHYLIFRHPDAAYADAGGQYENIRVDYDRLKAELDRMLG